MKCPFLIGIKIYLRPLNEEDLNETYLSWINDPVVTAYMETGTFPTSVRQLQKYYSDAQDNPNMVHLAIMRTVPETGGFTHEEHIGNIALNQINWVNRTAYLGIMIGEKKCWGRGYGTEACKLLVDYAFMKLNLHKISLGVFEEHTHAVRSYLRAGFKVEAMLKKEIYRDGKYHNKVIMSVFNEKS